MSAVLLGQHHAAAAGPPARRGAACAARDEADLGTEVEVVFDLRLGLLDVPALATLRLVLVAVGGLDDMDIFTDDEDLPAASSVLEAAGLWLASLGRTLLPARDGGYETVASLSD